MKQAPQTRFWTAKKTTFFCWTVIGLVLFHMASVFFSDTQAQSMIKRGDFSAFYAAALIVREGLGDRLYDSSVLQAVQNLYWPSLQGRYVLFPYPPFAAFFLIPFSVFPPLAAKGFFVLAMIGCLLGAVYFAAPYAPILHKNKLGLAAFFLAFFPLNFGIVGGQNIALSMLLYAAVLYFFNQKDQKGDWIAGVLLGLWLFKPHYSLALAFLFLCAGYFRVLAGVAGVGIFYYLLSAGIAGRDWVFTWLGVLKNYMALESQFNFFNMISLHGFLAAIGRGLSLGAGALGFLHFVSFICGVSLMAGLGFLAFQLRKKPKAARRVGLIKLLHLAMPAILLASPHTLFYDIGLSLVACAPYLKLQNDKRISFFIILTALASLTVSFRSWIPVQPLFFGNLGILVYLLSFEKRGHAVC